mmetsp:Transcript_11898/g.27682  ORF Transcript_11898/g.27682 Transcript_11898/m.27682 type:complete len:340 (-) Transcript_11898:549-1568(-)
MDGPLLCPAQVYRRVLWVEVCAHARRHPADEGLVLGVYRLFVRAHALELDQIRALQPLAHAPLRHPPVARHRHQRLGPLRALVHPPHLPHAVRVLPSIVRALEYGLPLLLAHIVHGHRAVVEPHREQVEALLRKGQRRDAALRPVHPLRVLWVLETPEEYQAVPLLAEVKLPVTDRQQVGVQVVPRHARHVPPPAQVALVRPQDVHAAPLGVYEGLLGGDDWRHHAAVQHLLLVVYVLHHDPLHALERVPELGRRQGGLPELGRVHPPTRQLGEVVEGVGRRRLLLGVGAQYVVARPRRVLALAELEDGIVDLVVGHVHAHVVGLRGGRLRLLCLASKV